MLHGARIALLLLSALSANMVPACGRSFGPGAPPDRDVARATAAPDQASFSLAALHHVPLVAAFASSASTTDVRYVANSGMLVTASGRRFLIDAPIREGIAPYATSSAAERASLEGARAPYADVDAILITHWHEDHFSAEAVAAHLSSNPRAILVSSPEVVDRVRAVAPGLAASRLRAVLPAPGQSQRVDVGGVGGARAAHPPQPVAAPSRAARRLPDRRTRRRCSTSATPIPPPTTSRCCDRFRRSTWRSSRSGMCRTPATGGWWPMRSGRGASSRCTSRRATSRRSTRGAARTANVAAVVAASPGSALDVAALTQASASCLSTTAGSSRIAWTAGPMAAASATAAMNPATRTIVDQSVGAIPYS